MKKNYYAVFLLVFASIYVLIINYLAFSSRGLQKALVLPILLFIFIVYHISKSKRHEFITKEGKWLLLLFGTIIVQTLVIATGGLQSPFLILIHLFMIGISFIFTFTIASIFLLLSFIVIFSDISFNTNLFYYLTTNLSNIILQLVSLFSIIPLAYIVSQQYHLKDMLSSILRLKVTTDEAILESLDELIIVTDQQLNILSINDAVERTLQKSRSEIINKPLFSILLLKKRSGELVTKELFFPKGDTNKNPLEVTDEFTVINSPPIQNTVTVQVQRIKNTEANINNISFIISFTNSSPVKGQALLEGIEKARTKYEALTENLKKKLLLSATPDMQNQMLLLEKIENDIYDARTLTSSGFNSIRSQLDIAKLCGLLVYLEQDFAKLQQVPVTFTIKNFGKDDIASLTVENYPVEPSQLTGPFFTVPCDVKLTELLVKKLLDMGIFLASGASNANVELQVERQGKNAVLITLIAKSPSLSQKDLQDLFKPNYGKLNALSKLNTGSGLEGSIIKTICDQQEIPLTFDYKASPEPHVLCSIKLMKLPKVRSKRGR